MCALAVAAGHAQLPMRMIAHAVYSRLLVPSFVVDISEQLAGKMAAIRAHASQFYRTGTSEPETRISARDFLAQIETRARYYGSLIGTVAGEPFYVREALNVDDPVALLMRPM